MTDQEALAKIAEKMEAINKLIAECENIADENEVSFHFDGPSYGMGGTYSPKFESSNCYEDGEFESSSCYEEETGGWSASSQSC